MKLGWDSKTGLNRKLTSWRSTNDPSSGDFTYGLDHDDGLPQFVTRKGPITTFRGGPWYGTRFSGSPLLRDSQILSQKFDDKADEALYSYDAVKNLTERFMLSADGTFQQVHWDDDAKYWYTFYTFPGDLCDGYGICGDFGVCKIYLMPQCDCMAGFKPKSPQDWKKFRWSDGCVRKDSQICGNGEGFKRISSVKLPDSSGYLVNVNTSIQDCEAACLNNCSCLAYGLMELSTGGYGCVTWFQQLLDVRFVGKNGQDLYVRVAASELDSANRKLIVVLSVSVASLISFFVLFVCFILKRRRKVEGDGNTAGEIQFPDNEVEMPLYDFTAIETATNNFSFSNKIGQGGFGPVYKGILPCGQHYRGFCLERGNSSVWTRNCSKKAGLAKQKSRLLPFRGYMSPEYAIDGYFLLKSDIFSFGVILLEIVSSKKNRGFFHPDHQLNLLGDAWKLWDEGNGLELMDVTLEGQFQNSEALRCIQVVLLCVQHDPDERPTMWSVLSMLESENFLLSHPKRPGFYTERMVSKKHKLSAEMPTSNEVIVTLLDGR